MAGPWLEEPDCIGLMLMQDLKGKGRAVSTAGQSQEGRRALEALLGVLGSQVCHRSSSHLELALQLLHLVLQAVNGVVKVRPALKLAKCL